jgi:hypothetical protein
VIFRGAKWSVEGRYAQKLAKSEPQASFEENLADIEGYGRIKWLRKGSYSSIPGRFERILQEALMITNIQFLYKLP